MKIFYSFAAIFISLSSIQFAVAQSIGIGTNSPAARLDIARPAGDTPTLNIRGTTNTSHFNIGPGEYTYIRGGRAGSQVLINDFPGSGFIGFGTANPLTRFHFFNGSSGNFFPNGLMALEGNANTYMNILAPNANETGLLFGKTTDAVSGGIVYNNTATINGLQFRTNGNINRMVIDANGNVGIGNNNPEFTLDVANRMRIRSGGGFSSAGLYFNRNDNSQVGGFAGMQDDTHVGFWGNPVGWAFTMNTTNGAFRINGVEGAPGQALTSTGAGTEWKSPTNALYDQIQTFSQSANLQTTGYAALPGLSQTINTPACKIVVIIKGHMQNDGCFGCTENAYKFDLAIDNVLVDRNFISVANGSNAIAANGAFVFPLTSGSHTISLSVDAQGDQLTAWGYRMVIIVLPQ